MSVDEIKFYLQLADTNCENIGKSDSGKELRVAWEDFLANFSRTIGKMISYSEKNTKTKIWSHRLKNASTKDDEGMVFLREARNATEHALEPFAAFRDREVNIGGFIRIGGNSSITTSNNLIVKKGIARPMGDFTMHTVGGRIDSIVGKPNEPITESPSHIFLRPITSQEKRQTYPVPKSIFGIGIDTTKPQDIAICAMRGLKEKFEEMLKLQK